MRFVFTDGPTLSMSPYDITKRLCESYPVFDVLKSMDHEIVKDNDTTLTISLMKKSIALNSLFRDSDHKDLSKSNLVLFQAEEGESIEALGHQVTPVVSLSLFQEDLSLDRLIARVKMAIPEQELLRNQEQKRFQDFINDKKPPVYGQLLKRSEGYIKRLNEVIRILES